MKKFTLNEKRMKLGYKAGFELGRDGCIAAGNVDCACFFSSRFDSGVEGNQWGRLALDMDMPPDRNVLVYGYAADELQLPYKIEKWKEITVDDFLQAESIDVQEKLRLFECSRAKQFASCKDMLLYGLKGRYFWFAVVVVNPGEFVVRGGTVYAEKENFLSLLPEIYQREDSFFERYLSIFSSMHMDLAQQIKELSQLFDPERIDQWTLPCFDMLLGGSNLADPLFSVVVRQKLLARTAELLSCRGTARAVELAVSIYTGQECEIAERNLIRTENLCLDIGTVNRLYGNRPDMFTVLVDAELTEGQYRQLCYLISRVQPADTQANVVLLRKERCLGGYCFLDINACLADEEPKALGQCCELDSGIFLA